MFMECLVVAFLVLGVSYCIARFSGSTKPQRDLDAFLFKGNSHLLAITSNIGSLLSIALVFSLYTVLLIGGGLAMALPVVGGLSAVSSCTVSRLR